MDPCLDLVRGFLVRTHSGLAGRPRALFLPEKANQLRMIEMISTGNVWAITGSRGIGMVFLDNLLRVHILV